MADNIRLGRCLNINRCGIADNGGRVRLAPDAPFVCSECGRELVDAMPLAKRNFATFVAASYGPRRSRRGWRRRSRG